MNRRNPAIKRILADVKELQTHPSSRYFAQPLEDNMFEWHFTIRGPADTPFAEGIYHGRILLPTDYPMKPPNIVFLTKNGRFEVGTKICLSISAYHEETWQPAWGIRTMLEAIISFMPTEGMGAIGALDWTPEERRRLAQESRNFCCSVCGKVADLLSDPSADAKPSATEAESQKLQADAQHMAAQVAQMHMTAPAAPSSPKVPGAGAGFNNDFLGANMGRNAEAALMVPAEMLDGAATATAVVDSAMDENGGGDSAALSTRAAGIDLDGDGIPDTVDVGGEMPAGTAVDSTVGNAGAGVDLDGDGIVDTDLDFSAAAQAQAQEQAQSLAQDLSARTDAGVATDSDTVGATNPGGGIDFNGDGVADTIDLNTAAPGGEVDLSAAAGAGVGGEELADTLTRGMTARAEELCTAPADALDNYEGLGLVEQRDVPQCLPCSPPGSAQKPLSSQQTTTAAAAGATVEGSTNELGHSADASSAEPAAQTGLRQRLQGTGAASVGRQSVRAPQVPQQQQPQQQQRLQEAIDHVQGRLHQVGERQLAEAVAEEVGAGGDAGAGAGAGAVRRERDAVDEWLGIVLIALASSMVLMLWRIVARYYTLFL